jgi:FkbM family methyltransferase
MELELASAAGCRTVELDGETTLCRVLSRYACHVNSADTAIGPHLLRNGFWESWITQALARCLRPGQRCVDLGANYGYYSLLMADGIGPSGRILAVEPNPEIATLLTRNLAVNGFSANATVVEGAATDHAGDRVSVYMPPGRMMNTSMFLAGLAGVTEIEVETVTVDQITAGWDRVDLIKVDIEGAEESVWRGMQGTLARNEAIVVVLEFNPGRHCDDRDFLERMQRGGFPLRFIDFDSTIKALDLDQCLGDVRDWMLYLSRHPITG